MFNHKLTKLLTCLLLTVALTLGGLVPGIGQSYPAYAADLIKNSSESYFTPAVRNSSTDWNQVCIK